MPRKKSLGPKYTRIRNVVKKTLEDKEIYDPSDEILLDDLMYNLKLQDDAKADIEESGFRINVVKDPLKTPHYQQNPSIGVYVQTSKNVGSILTKLGVTPQERVKLRLGDGDGEDPFQQLLFSKKPTSKVS